MANIDYPRRPTLSRVAHKEEYKNLLDQYQSMGLNAVIVQIRPASDALYPSEYAPWSKYLTGREDTGPEPDYNPLEFMIEETHRRGMEFHAWLNPYRATVDKDTLKLSLRHVFNRHRNWMVPYGRRYYLNPAMPEVRQYLTDVVTEVVENYDVDAIHFDDYFYPYKENGEIFPDSLDFAFYGRGYKDIGDWRRNNVDALIEKVSTRIKEIKPHVKFGISPFGVWRNKAQDPYGSDTRAGVTCYDDLYADVLKWMRNGWIDYIIPQLYWNLGFPPADFAILADWWSRQARECQLIIGHGAYKVGENQELAWHEPDEIPRQIKFNRQNLDIDGSAYYSSRSIMRNLLGLKDSLRVYYEHPALLPEMENLGLRDQAAPDLKNVRSKSGEVFLKWRPDKSDAENLPFYYAIYRFEGNRAGLNYEDGANLLAVTSLNDIQKKYTYLDKSAEPGKFYTYVVKAVNRQHSESQPSVIRRILKTENGVKRVR
ncbi:MAG: hypothetical protein DHS20C18_30280 [Saprospiraceae bacterium]|nr:MAG: hypothetical protein DHS20C18_30280 [Saprospiraceae bacterium]